jgi:hypothetical protein
VRAAYPAAAEIGGIAAVGKWIGVSRQYRIVVGYLLTLRYSISRRSTAMPTSCSASRSMRLSKSLRRGLGWPRCPIFLTQTFLSRRRTCTTASTSARRSGSGSTSGRREAPFFSIEKVRGELIAGDDELSTWAQARGEDFFLPPDSAILPSLATVSTWASSGTYEAAAVSTFLQVADYYLVAHATSSETLVLLESAPSSPPLPTDVGVRSWFRRSAGSALVPCPLSP